MLKRVSSGWTATIACAVVICASGCGGGGSSTADAGGASPPSSLAPPPPPPPTGTASTVIKPAVFIEYDADGTPFVRVQEQTYNAFAPSAAQQVMADVIKGPAPGSNNVIEGDTTTDVHHVDVVQMKYGLTLQASGMTSIYNYTYNQFDGGGAIYGAAIKLGDNGRPTDGSTYIQRVAANGMQAPDPTYTLRNTDFIGVEVDSGPIYIRDVTGRNFGDAGIDTKSTQVYVMNATLDSGHRMLRAWPNVEITLVNAIINAAPGQSQGWLGGPGATVRYYNTLWCVGAANPSPSDPNCKTSPTVVEGEDMTTAEALTHFIPLQSNPLPGVSSFFKTQIDQVVVEYSADSGATWKTLDLPNTGAPNSAPVGDMRWKIPLNMSAANYRFRASFMKLGVKVGDVSSVVGEDGNTIG